jgi:ABC-type glutathione transport system ATPase component
LEPKTAGSVRLTVAGTAHELLAAPPRERRFALAHIGWIPQDPGAALDPRASVLEAVVEPLLAHARAHGAAARSMALACLERCGLSRAQAARLPHQLSGGERQRAVLARAMVLEPAVLFLDEPTSSLDASIAAHLVDRVLELVRTQGLAALWVTHDVGLARWCSDRALVLDAGRLVESGPTAQLLQVPNSAAARRLLRAADWSDAQSLTP